jgi:hypothetical protein
MAKKYPVEKILYFADKPERLHVAPTEKSRSTDLWLDVQRLVDRGELERVAEDDSGWYYGTTPAGKEKLLTLQIQWRRDNGKPTQKERDALAALRASI